MDSPKYCSIIVCQVGFDLVWCRTIYRDTTGAHEMSRIGDRYDQAVRAWMAKHGQPVPAQAIAFTDYPAALRVRLITEETEEFVEAWQAGDRIEMIDALADVLYVAYGAVVAAGGVVEVADEVAKTAPVELG